MKTSYTAAGKSSVDLMPPVTALQMMDRKPGKGGKLHDFATEYFASS
jgi:hypothetical protein